MNRPLKILITLSLTIASVIGIFFLILICLSLVQASPVILWFLFVIGSFVLLLQRRKRKEENQRPKLITTIFSTIALSHITFLIFYLIGNALVM